MSQMGHQFWMESYGLWVTVIVDPLTDDKIHESHAVRTSI